MLIETETSPDHHVWDVRRGTAAGELTFQFRAHDLRKTAATGMAEAGVLRDRLRLLEEREQEREAVLTEQRHEIEIGVEQAKAGQLSDGRVFFEQLRQKIRSAS